MAVGGFKRGAEGFGAFHHHERGVALKGGLNAGSLHGGSAESHGQFLEALHVRVGEQGGLFRQFVQRLAGTGKVKRISQYEKGFLFSHDEFLVRRPGGPLSVSLRTGVP